MAEDLLGVGKALSALSNELRQAVAVLIEAIHREVPAASMRPLPPYDDEDFTLEVRIPAGLDRETVMDVCLRQALAVEDQFGFLILTRVKPAAPETPA